MTLKKNTKDDATISADEEARMTFTEHLGELRSRIMYSAIAIAAAFIVCYIYSDALLLAISRPLQAVTEPVEEEATGQGLYIAEIDAGGNRLWDVVLGDYLAGLDLAAFEKLTDGRLAVAANRALESGESEGLVVVAVPTPEEIEVEKEETEKEDEAEAEDVAEITNTAPLTPYIVDSIETWSGIVLSDIRAQPDGGYTIVGLRFYPGSDAIKTALVFDGGQFLEGYDRESIKTAKVSDGQGGWTYLSPLEPFLVKIKISGYAAIVLAFPVLVWQLCAFVFPGLKPSERRLTRTLIIGCGFFSLLGVCVAYFGIFPVVLPYLLQWAPEGFNIQFRVNETVSLIIKGLLGFSIAFQLPMVVLTLVYLDLLSPETLKKYRRLAIVGILILSAVLTPPDPGSLILMGGPLVLLYEASIWMSYVVVRRRKRAQEADV